MSKHEREGGPSVAPGTELISVFQLNFSNGRCEARPYNYTLLTHFIPFPL